MSILSPRFRPSLPLQRLPQLSQIGVIILFTKETGTAVMAVLHELHDLQRRTIKMGSGRPGTGKA